MDTEYTDTDINTDINTDIVKIFENNDAGMHVTIRGSHEEPLFRASDIGEILEISNIRTSTKDFDNTEKHGVHIMDSMGRNQETTFLTEKGLYKIVFRSRKPIAEKFTNWVCEVLKELRLNGKYELEKQIKDITVQKEQNLLTNFKNKPIIYIGYTEENVIKFGYTDDIETRIKDHKREIKENWTPIYVYESLYNREIERQIKDRLKKYKIDKIYGIKKQTELIQLSNDFTINDLNKEIEKIKYIVESNEIDRNKNSQINQLKVENTELKSKLLEKDKIIRDMRFDIREKLKEPNEIQEMVISDDQIYDENLINEQNNNFFIARHIKTGEEKLFSCAAQIGKYVNFDPKSIMSYRDIPRLVHGYHIRTFGNSYWQPCIEYTYNEDSVPYKNTRAIQSINTSTNQIKIYESLAETIRILNIDDGIRKQITRSCTNNKVIVIDGENLKWSYPSICGEFIKCLNKFNVIDGKKINSNKTQKNEKYLIIARNIETHQETYCKTAVDAKKLVGNSDISNYLDQPAHLKGYTFRSFDADKWWISPENFKYIPDYVTKQKFFIKATNNVTKEIVHYNSAFEMAVLFNLCSLTDDSKTKENMRELVKRVVNGEVKTSNYKILNDHTFEQFEKCGYYLHKDGTSENL